SGATSVSFGGVLAAPTFVSSTQVRAVVPATARTGHLDLTTPVGIGHSSGTFRVLPRISMVSPGTGTAGITVTIAGSGFTDVSAASLFVLPRVGGFSPGSALVGAKVTINGNAFAGATGVLFNGVLALPATVTSTQITVLVPADASTGKLTVVTPSGSGQSNGT